MEYNIGDNVIIKTYFLRKNIRVIQGTIISVSKIDDYDSWGDYRGQRQQITVVTDNNKKVEIVDEEILFVKRVIEKY